MLPPSGLDFKATYNKVTWEGSNHIYHIHILHKFGTSSLLYTYQLYFSTYMPWTYSNTAIRYVHIYIHILLISTLKSMH